MGLIFNNLSATNIIGSNSSPTGTFRVGLMSPDTVAWMNDVSSKIVSASSVYTGLTVTTTVTSSSTAPTFATTDYDAILFWSDGQWTWNASMTNAYNANVGLVTAQFWGSVGVTGVPSNVMPTVNSSGGQDGVNYAWPSTVQTHPIALGANAGTQAVTNFIPIGFLSTNPTLVAGATTVVQYTNSQPAVVVKEATAPTARTVYLNMFPPSSTVRSDFWTASTQGGLLMLNALLWAARRL